MGSLIHLRVGRLEVDWGKNNSYGDHRALFQSTDLKLVPYFYVDRGSEADADETEEVVESEEGYRWKLMTEMREGYAKPLGEIVDRIELLGHTDAVSRREFSFLANLNGFDESLFTYDELAEALRLVDVESVSLDYGEGGADFGKFFRREIFPRLPFDVVAAHPNYIRYDAAQAMENLSAYTVLRLLSSNPSARDLPVIWGFHDVLTGGYGQRSDFVRPLDADQRFSVLTEGTSDAAILKHAIALLQPHLSDFFSFIDIAHPFSGTGQVYNFLRGLIAIGVRNDILVVFDNDAEGRAAWVKCRQLEPPDNIRILKLPNRTEFENISVDGPTGSALADINGRAAAIECYLDLGGDARFRWSNYNQHVAVYQGELLGKENYKRQFLDQRRRERGYDYTKLGSIVEMFRTEAMVSKQIACLKSFAGSED